MFYVVLKHFQFTIFVIYKNGHPLLIFIWLWTLSPKILNPLLYSHHPPPNPPPPPQWWFLSCPGQTGLFYRITFMLYITVLLLYITKCVEDFNRQSNIFLSNFKHANSNIRNTLFQNYCTSFYGRQILPLFGNCMEDIYTAWRIAMCTVWRVI